MCSSWGTGNTISQIAINLPSDDEDRDIPLIQWPSVAKDNVPSEKSMTAEIPKGKVADISEVAAAENPDKTIAIALGTTAGTIPDALKLKTKKSFLPILGLTFVPIYGRAM